MSINQNDNSQTVENDIDSLDPRKFIIIKGAAVHNLRKIDVAIPRNQFVVITGLSGSGKSSLAFDTLYAEGQRRYVESLSSYARQFLGRMDKPEVDYIKGISPAIAIEQKVNTRNPRSTVGTTTEIYDYLKLLFARIGKTYSPVSNKVVKKQTVENVVDFIGKQPEFSKIIITCPLITHPGRSVAEEMKILLQKGFTRIMHKKELIRIEDYVIKPDKSALEKPVKEKKKVQVTTKAIPDQKIYVLIDRLVRGQESTEDEMARLADSAQTAFNEGHGTCLVSVESDSGEQLQEIFSNRFEADGLTFEEPSVHFFSFNNPFGACKRCEGFGSVIGIDEDLVVADKSMSVYEGAIACWRGEKMKVWNDKLVMHAFKFDFPIHRPYFELSDFHKKLLWTGNKYFKGLDAFFKHIEEQSYKIQYRVMLSRYRGKTNCPDCKGSRLRPDANYVKVGNKSITDLVLMPVKESYAFFNKLKLDEHDTIISKRLLTEIVNRLQYMNEVGLGYLTLNRLSNSLSGGESQRINLASSLGTSLVGSMYILDEPSIGLHPRDTLKLIGVLKALQKTGNTLIVVEHDEEIMRAADQLIDIGPMAGTHGGELIFQGNFNNLKEHTGRSLTAKYLTGKESIPLPKFRRSWKKYIEIKGARENNLKNIDVKFPLQIMTVVTGVSGSGKTSLVKKILFPAIKKIKEGYGEQTGNFDKLSGDYLQITAAELVDQNPIGRTSRSNPVTYVKAYDEIRSLFAEQPLAKKRGYKPAHFSFNVEGGRCEVCAGEGYVKIEMQFMADIRLKCENCQGKRFKEEVLQVTYLDKNIDDILEMTVDDAILFFDSEMLSKYTHTQKKIIERLKPLSDVGLGYICLGQSSSTLSGGEAQRIKLASFLGKGQHAAGTLFVFDEPTTGLHFHDIKKLLYAFNALIDQGNTIIIIEHNPEVIKCADWVIDLGPEGGEEGGNIIFEGLPEQLVKCKDSYTGLFLKGKV